MSLSCVLHLTLDALRQSPLSLHAADLSASLHLYPSELSRMKWLHLRPQYGRLVCRKTLRLVVTNLFQRYPALSLRQRRDGVYRVIYRKQFKENKMGAFSPSDNGLWKKAPRSGTTRWFLQQEALLDKG